jgi:hypothetical protein
MIDVGRLSRSERHLFERLCATSWRWASESALRFLLGLRARERGSSFEVLG